MFTKMVICDEGDIDEEMQYICAPLGKVGPHGIRSEMTWSHFDL